MNRLLQHLVSPLLHQPPPAATDLHAAPAPDRESWPPLPATPQARRRRTDAGPWRPEGAPPRWTR
ncbi:hypothetical protein [Vulcaniibacterium gelatinicum]|uniref:hypothetical protein n=1 Tax=Vulcaniibacterium gelatinicum TaxID=2598725 RepID=UPI0011CCBBDB|nr:hypothetical protein [Vulcaniibacterium gelatinicum]